jgi:fucose 4-O-acetylase-like acetyltransferase
MSKNISLISRDSSLVFKGFLLLLVIIGHNSILMDLCVNGFLKKTLYLFHVYCFFSLPFLYGYKDTVGSTSNILNDIKKNFINLYVPYFWFTLFSTFVFFLLGNPVDLKNSLWAFFMGGNIFLVAIVDFISYGFYLQCLLS